MKIPVEFVCDCEAETMFEYEKPVLYSEPILIQFTCSGCKSIWEARFRESWMGTKYAHRLVKGTQKLADVLMKKKQHERANAPQKKAAFILNPGLPGKPNRN